MCADSDCKGVHGDHIANSGLVGDQECRTLVGELVFPVGTSNSIAYLGFLFQFCSRSEQYLVLESGDEAVASTG